ncbi:MAG: poly(3-hydroxybutyrate) depolymerase [bacterium]|nr:poly(3-hydroxybutyrate) depolymerase [bacterium]
MRRRTRVLGAVFLCLSLPLLVALIEAVDFHLDNRNSASIVSSGERREYLLYVPESYHGTRPVPLVVSLHGGGIWPSFQRDLSGWNRVAEQHGFIVVYPAGLGAAWRVTRLGSNIMKDVRFISDLIDTLEKTYNVDPTRIYANGLSNGGGMTFVLSCTLADRVAAFGLVASAQMLPFDWCPDLRPVPLISFHGTDDELTPYEGGNTFVAPGGWEFPDVSEWTANWARRNRCRPDPTLSAVAPDVTRREYTGCDDDTAVVLYTIHGGGHTWPGSESMPEWFLGPTSQGVDASEQMWEFFQEHQLPM